MRRLFLQAEHFVGLIVAPLSHQLELDFAGSRQRNLRHG